MAVTLKTLSDDEIPVTHRREGLEVLYAVYEDNGTVHYLESDVEAAQLVVQLSEKE